MKYLGLLAKILVRIARARKGNFGDSEAVGRGVSEMRIFVGKGYRVYYTKTGKNIVWLLCGGDKNLTIKAL
jgi:putative addiction module killer protein